MSPRSFCCLSPSPPKPPTVWDDPPTGSLLVDHPSRRPVLLSFARPSLSANRTKSHQLASPRGPACPEAPPTQFREGGRHGGSPTGSRRPKQAPRRNGAPNHVVLGHVRGPGSPIPKIPFLWPRGLSDGGKPDAALSSWEDIYIGTGTLPLPYAAPTGTHHPQSNGTNLYIDWAKSPHTHQLAGASDHRQPSSPTGPPKPPTAREGANRPVIP